MMPFIAGRGSTNLSGRRLFNVMKIETKHILSVVTALLLIFLTERMFAQSYGLIFSSYESIQEKRTSLDLGAGAPLCLSGDFALSFDLSFIPDRSTYFGYIFRLINNRHQNIDLVYNQQNNTFSVVTGDTFTDIRFRINQEQLFGKWNRFSLQVHKGQLSFFVNGRLINRGKANISDPCFRIIFGACQLPDFKSTDLPPMQLRNISIHNGNKLKYHWPLQELSGNSSPDSLHDKKAAVINPVWIRPLHTDWQLLWSGRVPGNASIAFDRAKEELYVVASDSIYRFSLKDRAVTGTGLASAQHHLLLGNQSLFHPGNGQLYNFFIDKEEMTAFRPAEKKWEHPFDSADVTEYWQANKFFSGSQNALYVLGGYGQLRYKNRIARYSFDDGQWKEASVTGDAYMPRYLAALGATGSGDTAYVLGGYGSTTGQQVLNPKYTYDLLLFDVKRQSFKKLYTLQPPSAPFVFANSMVLDSSGQSFYALIFPNDRFDSRLQLIKGSLRAPSYTLAGNPIPYAFQDTRSFADLFWCPSARMLLAATLLTDKNKATTVKLYGIAFPPNELPLATAPWKEGRPWGIFLLALLVLSLGIYLLFRRRKGRRATAAVRHAPLPVTEPLPQETVVQLSTPAPKPAVFLFGNFEVRDREGQDISRLFTPLLKELFLLITVHTLRYGHGISPEGLNEILWNDKSGKAAKNNRSVNMLKLKAILEKVGDFTLRKESGSWVLYYPDAEIYIDLAAFLQLADHEHDMDKERIRQVLHIVKRGAFLYQTDYSWLDDIKSDISGKALDMLLSAGNLLSVPGDAEWMTEIAGCIFQFDAVNEQALRLKCKSLISLGRHSLARNAYEKFSREYKHMYGEDFPESFQEIIHEQIN